MSKEKKVISRLGSHTVEGKEYANLPEIAEEYNMTVNAIYKRYSRGCRGDDLVPPKKRKNYIEPIKEKKPLKYEFEAGGKTYRNAAAACKELGINYITYRRRISDGWTVEEALEIVPRIDGRHRKKKYRFHDEEFTADELSEKFNVPKVTILDRLNRGANIRQAVGLEKIIRGSLLSQSKAAKSKRPRIEVEIDGKTYRSYRSLAKAYDKPDYVVRQRIVDYGYTPEQAVKLKGKGKEVIVGNETYNSMADAARAYGMTLEILLANLYRGLTIEQSLGIEEYETINSIEYEGNVYKNLPHLAEDFGIPATTLRSRMSAGATLKEAIEAGERIINEGRYNEVIFGRNPELANSIGELYFIKLFLDEKPCYKIGITSRNVQERFKGYAFDYEIISKYTGKMIEIYRIEREILDFVGEKRLSDISAKLLDGYTEVLELTEEETVVIASLLKERLSE